MGVRSTDTCTRHKCLFNLYGFRAGTLWPSDALGLKSQMAFRDPNVAIIETSRAYIRAGIGLYELLRTPTVVRLPGPCRALLTFEPVCRSCKLAQACDALETRMAPSQWQPARAQRPVQLRARETRLTTLWASSSTICWPRARTWTSSGRSPTEK